MRTELPGPSEWGVTQEPNGFRVEQRTAEWPSREYWASLDAVCKARAECHKRIARSERWLNLQAALVMLIALVLTVLAAL